MKKLLLLTFCAWILDPQPTLQAQQHNQRPEHLKANGVWAFGPNTGMNFNKRPAEAFKTGMIANGGSASVASAQTGELLFYTSGRQIYNRNHQVMSNGVLIATQSVVTSPFQGVCIVPSIDSASQYYVFTVEREMNNNKGNLTYSIVDTRLNSGLGDVVVGKKNIVLDSNMNGSLVTIPGNNCDVWLIAHRRDSAIFKTYNIGKGGISETPMVSYTGTQIQGKPGNLPNPLRTLNTGAYSSSCRMAVAPDRTMLALSTNSSYNMFGSAYGYPFFPGLHGTLLYKFNATSGQVSDALVLDTSISLAYGGLCFSPDNSKLYLTADSFDENTFYGEASIYQYEIGNYDETKIRNSRKYIAGYEGGEATNLALYNDTIYMASYKDFKEYLSRINKPNLSGIACDFEDAVPALHLKANSASFDLPNQVSLPLAPDTVWNTILDTSYCNLPENIKLNGKDGFSVYLWDDGSTQKDRSVTERGAYWLMATDGCHTVIDSFLIGGKEIDPVSVQIDGFTLIALGKYTSWQWYLEDELIPGATNSSYTVTQNGHYTVYVTDAQGCSDAASYKVTNVGLAQVDDTGSTVQVFPNPAKNKVSISANQSVTVTIFSLEGKCLLKESNKTIVDLNNFVKGIYFMKIMNKQGLLLRTVKLMITD